MNLSTLRDQAAKFAGDLNQTRYAAADYIIAANRAQEQFALDTRSLWKDTTYTSADGTATHSLPSDFMFEESVYFDGKLLRPLDRRFLALYSPATDWTLTTGTPTNFMIDPEEAQKKLRLYPIPTSADANKTITLRYYPLPTAVSADTDVPLNSSALLAQFHMGIAAYMAWLLLNSETVTPEVSAKKRDMLGIYNDMVAKSIDLFGNTVSAGMRLRGSRPV